VKRILVANRGEIAVRVIRACRALGLQTVAVYSEADRGALHTRLADRALCIGPPAASQSYLNVNAILAVAKGTGCDAVHPGYGFLAENAAFAEACRDHGVIFVGPPPEAMRALGDKLQARHMARTLGVPTVPGSAASVKTPAEAEAVAARIGYPILLKAAAGGGGRGMRVVRAPGALVPALEQAGAEAGAAFGDPTLFIERFLENVRHVEVQIIADAHRSAVHLGERDCSVQRRHQKLLEEAPSPVLTSGVRGEMTDAALVLCRHAGYVNAATVEFVLEADGRRFYFLEVNTRIQVEHPVTEMVTGIDLVQEQLRVAAGERLRFSQPDVRLTGHAVECRINAETPGRDFAPSPGTITTWRAPVGPGLRVDTHCQQGSVVPPFYDSLVAKLIAGGPTRGRALERLRAALDSFVVEGIATTIPFHRKLIAHPSFTAGAVHTRWVEDVLMRS
jgi:acetyl-CoA carboxylase, biotin carboxylase subunit